MNKIEQEPVAWNDPAAAPDGFVLVPRDLTNEMVRAFCMATVLRWDDAPEDQKIEAAEKLQHAFDAMIAAAPQPAEQQIELAKYQPCGCVLCTCEHETQCQGCGAHHCGTHPVGQIPNPAYQQVDRQALAKIHASRAADDLHARNRLLVEALERCRHQASYSIGEEDALRIQLGKVRDIVNEALAARRKQGGGT